MKKTTNICTTEVDLGLEHPSVRMAQAMDFLIETGLIITKDFPRIKEVGVLEEAN